MLKSTYSNARDNLHKLFSRSFLGSFYFFSFWTESGRGAMADSTLGTVRSLLVDSSVFDSRMAETSKDHTFLGLTSDDAEGKQQGPLLSTVNMKRYFFWLVISFTCCKGGWMSFVVFAL